MLRYINNACVKSYICSSISCTFVIGNDFLRIISFGFLKPDQNLTVPFFGWINLEGLPILNDLPV